MKPAGANVRFCLAFWFPDLGSCDARSEGARTPAVYDYAGSQIRQKVHYSEEASFWQVRLSWVADEARAKTHPCDP